MPATGGDAGHAAKFGGDDGLGALAGAPAASQAEGWRGGGAEGPTAGACARGLTLCDCRAGKFSPFHGFIRMMSQHANVRDGGTSVDGVSRACLNKLVGLYYQEGMRKPARNGNPGDLDPGSCRLARHFLKARWRDPDDQEDLMVLQQIFSVMQRHEVDNCIAVLREFSKWRPGPAGRGGDRFNVRPSSDAGMDAVDAVLRNVRRRIEASRATVERSFAAEEDQNDDDCDDDTVSMRSTVVQGPTWKPKVQMSEPAAPVDKVQALHGLIQEIRKCNTSWANHSKPQPHTGLSTTGSSGHMDIQSSMASRQKSISSADLLHTLFRQVASQQAQATALTATPTPSPFDTTSSTAISSGHAVAVSSAIASRTTSTTPTRDDIMHASSARVQLHLCAPFPSDVAKSAQSSEDRPSSLSSLKLPSSDLTLPPLKHVLPPLKHVLLHAWTP